MANNNPQLFLKNFSNYDLFQDADPDALKTYVIDDVAVMNEFKITNGGTKNKSTVNKANGPDASPLPINMTNIKNKNNALWTALREGNVLGAALFSKGSETVNYSSVDLDQPVKMQANPAEYSEASLKFFK